MTELDDRLGQILRDAVPAPPRQLDPVAIRTGRPRSAGGKLRRFAPAVAAVVVVLAVAAGLVLARRDSSQRSAPGDNSHSVTAQVVLDRTTVPANGKPINGAVILTNHTGKPIEIADGTCTAWLAVVLSNHDTQRPNALWRGAACASAQLPVGVTRKPIQVSTTYTLCLQHGGSSRETPAPPRCTGGSHPQPPLLPPGRYAASVLTRGFSTQPESVRPITVTITRP